MQKPWLITDDDYAKHVTTPLHTNKPSGEGVSSVETSGGRMHPERPARLIAVKERLVACGLWDEFEVVKPKMIDEDELGFVHSPEYVKRVKMACVLCDPIMDSADTPICEDSYDVARLATGGVIGGVERAMDEDVEGVGGVGRRVFCLSRPPGHHAERWKAMGFCLFNHVAVAADYLTRKHKLTRVAIVDFDVHHGNGTQHAFEERSDVLFISMHEHPKYQYPGTGFEGEIGKGEGKGFTLNVPVMPRTGDEGFQKLFMEKVLPRLEEYKPEFVLVSAGFDAAKADPLGRLELSGATYEMMGRELVKVAKKHADGRIVSVLEGGYNLEALCECVEVYLRALIEA